MKHISYNIMFGIEDQYKYVAFNREGVLCGFANAPIRDFANGQWLDSVTGSTGEMILREKWDQSCREVALCADMRKNPPTCRAAEARRKNKQKGKA